MKKRWIIFWSFITLILLTIAAIPFFYRYKAKEIILQEANEQLNATLGFSEFSFSILNDFPNMTFIMHNCSLVNKGRFEGDTLVSTEEFRINLNIKKLVMENQVQIHSIELIKPSINIYYDTLGYGNYDILKEDTSAAANDTSSVDFSFKRLTFEDAFIRYYDQETKSELLLEGVNLVSKGDFDTDIFDLDSKGEITNMNFRKGKIQYVYNKRASVKMITEINLKENIFTMKENDFLLNHFRFTIDGKCQWKDEGYLVDYTIAAKETRFSNILSLLPGIYHEDMNDIETDGNISFKGYVKGLYSDKSVPAFRIDLNVNDGKFKYKSLPHPVDHIHLKVHAENPDGNPNHTLINIEHFKFRFDDNPVEGRFLMKGSVNPYIDTEIKAGIDLHELKHFLPLDSIEIRGRLDADIKMKGHYHKGDLLFPESDIKFSVANGYLRSASYPEEAMENIHLYTELINHSGKAEETIIELDTLTYTMLGESFLIEGEIKDLNNPSFDLKINGSADLGKLTQLFPIENVSLSGKVKTFFEAKGMYSDIRDKNYTKLDVAGNASIDRLSYKGPELKRTLYIENAQVDFSGEKIAVNQLNGSYGKSHYAINGHFIHYLPFLTGHHEHFTGDLDLKCDTIDIEDWITRSKIPAPVDTAKVTDQTPSEIIVIPDNIDFRFDSEIQYVKLDSIHLKKLKGEIILHEGVMTMNETGFNSLGSKFKLSGTYDTRTYGKAYFDINVKIKDLDISKAYATFYSVQSMSPAARNTDGIVTIQYHLKGYLGKKMQLKLKSLEGGGTITIKEAKIDGMKILHHVGHLAKKDELKNPQVTNIVMETEIRESQIFIKPFSFEISGFDATLEGSNDFDGNLDYILHMSLPHLDKIKIPFHIKGHYDDPKVSMLNKKEKE